VSSSIFEASVNFVYSRWRLLSVLNAVFFSVALGVGLTSSLIFPSPVYYSQPAYVLPQFLQGNVLLMFLFIFCFNLAVAAFGFITLPGFLFFPLSAVLLTLRAVLWGLLLGPLSSGLFLDVLPTLVLEGEAYVLAAAVGMTVGYSWLRRSADVSRYERFKSALKRGMSAYVLVILFLVAAAAVESATITVLRI
jgi:hypothetical protein